MKTLNTKWAIKALFNKNGLYCAIWLIVQQLLVAVSTLSIVRLIEHLAQDGYLSVFYTVLFVASLILVYAPAAFSHVYLKKFQFSSFENYISKFSDKNKGKRTFAHQRYKNQYESWITNESYIVFNDASLFLYEIFSTFLNSIINVLVIAWLLDLQLLIGYGVAFSALYLSNIFFKGIIEKASTQVQNSRKIMSNSLLSAWDNVLIGNDYNLKNWKSKFHELIGVLEKDSVIYVIKRFLISIFTIVVALAVIGFFVGKYIFDNSNNVAALSAMVVTFPRQIQIIQSIFTFFAQTLEWHGIKMKLNGLDTPINLETSKAIDQYCNLSDLEFIYSEQPMQCSEVSHLLLNLKSIENGRITIRGKNGAGKSTILSFLAENLDHEAFYLPTKSNLIFNENLSDSSDGEKIIQIIDELQTINLPKYVFLDEWDANLDLENIKILDRKIANLAKDRIIVEVRHRGATEALN